MVWLQSEYLFIYSNSFYVFYEALLKCFFFFCNFSLQMDKVEIRIVLKYGLFIRNATSETLLNN